MNSRNKRIYIEKRTNRNWCTITLFITKMTIYENRDLFVSTAVTKEHHYDQWYILNKHPSIPTPGENENAIPSSYILPFLKGLQYIAHNQQIE